jgi:parallel beta-helix repeat protein
MAAPLPNIITGNQIEGNDVGILLWNTAGNVIYHNNFINNGLHAYDNGAANMWDAGYPTGGNYWSGFTGPDTHLGPTQSEPGSDGIIDHSYVIDADSMDRYPLKNMYTYLGIIIDPVEVVEDPAPGEEPVAEPTPVPNTYDTPVDPLVIEPEATPEATPEAAPAPEIESLDSAPAMPVTEPLVTIPEVSLPDASIQPEVVQATESADPIWMALLAVSSLAVAVALFFRKRI